MDLSRLSPRFTPGSSVLPAAAGWRLSIPAGDSRHYQLAQLDDYSHLSRKAFLHSASQQLELRVRVSSARLPGTWGFGWWNDPFGLSLGFGGSPLRLPALPQAAWFFYGSSANYLSIQPQQPGSGGQVIPPNGFFASAFASVPVPSLAFSPGLPFLPLLLIRSFSRVIRKAAGRIIHQDGAPILVDVSQWHDYRLEWGQDSCRFSVDDLLILETPISPAPPLGLVIWLDNQYAAWRPDGTLRYGIQQNPAAWMEVQPIGQPD